MNSPTPGAGAKREASYRLPVAGWQRLLELRRATGTRLVLAWYDRAISPDATRLLADVPHQVTRKVADVAGTGPSVTRPAMPVRRPGAGGPGPEVAAALPSATITG